MKNIPKNIKLNEGKNLQSLLKKKRTLFLNKKALLYGII